MYAYVIRKRKEHQEAKKQNVVPKKTENKKINKNIDQKKADPPPPLTSCLWSSSDLIPFYESTEFKELLEWGQDWTQSQPSCLLFGQTACGKSRIIEAFASKLASHVIEIDCASISGIRELIQTCEESTKSRSVGIFYSNDESSSNKAHNKNGTNTKNIKKNSNNSINNNNDNSFNDNNNNNDSSLNNINSNNYNSGGYLKASSIVVLEHVDNLIPLHSDPSSSIINLIAKSRVPLIMTAQRLCFQPAEWLKIISCNSLPDPFSILKNAVWMHGSINKLPSNQSLHSLLSFTDNDIRASALQYQLWRDNSNSRLTREDQIYLSIPTIIHERKTKKEKRSMYLDLCELLISVDNDDQIFKGYIRPIYDTFKSKNRESVVKSYADFSKSKIPHYSFGRRGNLEITEIVYSACIHEVQVTRNRKGPCLNQPHNIKPYEVPLIKNWKLWPNKDRDLPQLEPSQYIIFEDPVPEAPKKRNRKKNSQELPDTSSPSQNSESTETANNSINNNTDNSVNNNECYVTIYKGKFVIPGKHKENETVTDSQGDSEINSTECVVNPKEITVENNAIPANTCESPIMPFFTMNTMPRPFSQINQQFLNPQLNQSISIEQQIMNHILMHQMINPQYQFNSQQFFFNQQLQNNYQQFPTMNQNTNQAINQNANQTFNQTNQQNQNC